jgi:5-hydroxyisourate hydrolase
LISYWEKSGCDNRRMSVNPNILTTHVLDTARGHPVEGMRIVISKNTNKDDEMNFIWLPIGETVTNNDGRGPGLLQPKAIETFEPGIYMMTFHTKDYFDRHGTLNFYPQVDIIFRIADVSQHYHIPLNLSPFGYSTYRGS